MYSPQVLDHFHYPRNRGQLQEPDAVGESSYQRCGDRLCLTFRLDGDVIEEVRARAVGCGVTVAAGSVATTILKGMTVEEARQLDAFQLDKALGGVPPSKRHAILMVLDCLARALGTRNHPRLSPPRREAKTQYPAPGRVQPCACSQKTEVNDNA